MSKTLDFIAAFALVAFIAFLLALWALDMTFAQYFHAVVKFYF